MIQAKDLQPGEVLVTPTDSKQGFTMTVETLEHQIIADEPENLGGDNKGMGPFELLSASLATCTAMTLRFYAKRENLEPGRYQVKVWAEQHQEGGSSGHLLKCALSFDEVEDPALKAKLQEIAEKCPVSRVLKTGVEIESVPS